MQVLTDTDQRIGEKQEASVTEEQITWLLLFVRCCLGMEQSHLVAINLTATLSLTEIGSGAAR
jgi:hypothetical protein